MVSACQHLPATQRPLNSCAVFIVFFLFSIASVAATSCSSLSGEPVLWVVPSKPGGGYDAYSRLLQPFMEKALNVHIRIENRSAAGGVVGAMAIRDAQADGRTLGIINAPGLLAANMLPNAPAPDPRQDFTILGKVAEQHVVMLTGKHSGISDINSLLAISRTRPILAGIRDAGSSNFITLPITASLLGMDYAVVTGYVGSGARTLAALRGEVDVIFLNMDSARRYIASNELVPLLQITDPPNIGLSDESRSLLTGVPVLSGEQGVARRQIDTTGLTMEDVEAGAVALARIFAAGRLVVAPRNLPDTVSHCIATALEDVMANPEFLQAASKANLGINSENAEGARKLLSLAAAELDKFQPEIRAAIGEARR